MRIKFEKGIVPERMAEHLVNYIRENNLIVGSVNVYIQAFDMQGKPVQESMEDYLVVSPGELSKKQYAQDVANIRRCQMKVVSC